MGLDSKHNPAFGIVSHEMSETTLRGFVAAGSPNQKKIGKVSHGICSDFAEIQEAEMVGSYGSHER